jgi:glycosyltransferase involved in cell wall biosynthesis
MSAEPGRRIFHVCNISPIFNDIAETLRFGFAELGCQVTCGPSIVVGAKNIVLGSHQIADWAVIPEDSILYNLEQLGSASLYLTAHYLDKLRRFTVWDYSARNIEWLASSGTNAQARLLPIGYAPTLERVRNQAEPDIDVLFYGWMNERRSLVIEQLRALGLQVVALSGSFGEELDGYIARSKIVINIHFYDTKIFEGIRVSYLLTNQKVVVSEIGDDTEIDPEMRRAVIGAPYESLAAVCKSLLDQPALRAEQAQLAHRIFSARSEKEFLAPLVEEVFMQEAAASRDAQSLVSVVIPCYNQAAFLAETVDSVLAQAYRNFEIIIVNDGSPDNTSEVAQKIIAENPGCAIRLLEQKNAGVASARNLGIESAQGPYILTLDADDKIHPEMLSKTVALLTENPDLSIAYTDYQHFGDVDLVVTTPEYDFETLYSKKCLHTATALFRKAAWTAAGGFNTNLFWGMEDWDFWIACGKTGHFGRRIPEVLFYYRTRLHEASRIKTANARFNELFARIVLNHPGLYDAERLAWARATWAGSVDTILRDAASHPKEIAYFEGLSEVQIISEAEVLSAAGRNDVGADVYRLWLGKTTSPLAYAIHFNRGTVLVANGQEAEAKEAFRRAIALRPDFSPAIVNLNRLNNCNNFGVSWIDIAFDFACEIHHCVPRAGGSANAFKVLNLATEPSIWCISSDELRKVADQFDLILTYRPELMDLPNAQFMVYGGCFVTEKPRTKRFEVSFLYSVGLANGMTGYALRKSIWDRRHAMAEHFKYYASAIRPPPDAENVWPHPTKDKLFESMFSLVIENTSEVNYFTEKLMDAFQTYTVPIYWGCPNIQEYFDPAGMIFVENEADVQAVVNRLTVDDYYSRLDAIDSNFKKSNQYKDILHNMQDAIQRGYASRVK